MTGISEMIECCDGNVNKNIPGLLAKMTFLDH